MQGKPSTHSPTQQSGYLPLLLSCLPFFNLTITQTPFPTPRVTPKSHTFLPYGVCTSNDRSVDLNKKSSLKAYVPLNSYTNATAPCGSPTISCTPLDCSPYFPSFAPDFSPDFVFVVCTCEPVSCFWGGSVEVVCEVGRKRVCISTDDI
jgi:hypothetical protein